MWSFVVLVILFSASPSYGAYSVPEAQPDLPSVCPSSSVVTYNNRNACQWNFCYQLSPVPYMNPTGQQFLVSAGGILYTTVVAQYYDGTPGNAINRNSLFNGTAYQVLGVEGTRYYAGPDLVNHGVAITGLVGINSNRFGSNDNLLKTAYPYLTGNATYVTGESGGFGGITFNLASPVPMPYYPGNTTTQVTMIENPGFYDDFTTGPFIIAGSGSPSAEAEWEYTQTQALPYYYSAVGATSNQHYASPAWGTLSFVPRPMSSSTTSPSNDGTCLAYTPPTRTRRMLLTYSVQGAGMGTTVASANTAGNFSICGWVMLNVSLDSVIDRDMASNGHVWEGSPAHFVLDGYGQRVYTDAAGTSLVTNLTGLVPFSSYASSVYPQGTENLVFNLTNHLTGSSVVGEFVQPDFFGLGQAYNGLLFNTTGQPINRVTGGKWPFPGYVASPLLALGFGEMLADSVSPWSIVDSGTFRPARIPTTYTTTQWNMAFVDSTDSAELVYRSKANQCPVTTSASQSFANLTTVVKTFAFQFLSNGVTSNQSTLYQTCVEGIITTTGTPRLSTTMPMYYWTIASATGNRFVIAGANITNGSRPLTQVQNYTQAILNISSTAAVVAHSAPYLNTAGIIFMLDSAPYLPYNRTNGSSTTLKLALDPTISTPSFSSLSDVTWRDVNWQYGWLENVDAVNQVAQTNGFKLVEVTTNGPSSLASCASVGRTFVTGTPIPASSSSSSATPLASSSVSSSAAALPSSSSTAAAVTSSQQSSSANTASSSTSSSHASSSASSSSTAAITSSSSSIAAVTSSQQPSSSSVNTVASSSSTASAVPSSSSLAAISSSQQPSSSSINTVASSSSTGPAVPSSSSSRDAPSSSSSTAAPSSSSSLVTPSSSSSLVTPASSSSLVAPASSSSSATPLASSSTSSSVTAVRSSSSPTGAATSSLQSSSTNSLFSSSSSSSHTSSSGLIDTTSSSSSSLSGGAIAGIVVGVVVGVCVLMALIFLLFSAFCKTTKATKSTPALGAGHGMESSQTRSGVTGIEMEEV